jgi:ureidoglycolate lyase
VTSDPSLLTVERLTDAAFEPFGTVIQTAGAEMRLINGGTTERYHRLAVAETDASGRAIVSLFRGQARVLPFDIIMMERHPEGSQAFHPLSGRLWLVVVAPDEAGRPGRPRVFLASGEQGVNYRRNVWHHPLMALEAASDFLVVDREGPGANLEEYVYPAPFRIPGLPIEEGSAP